MNKMFHLPSPFHFISGIALFILAIVLVSLPALALFPLYKSIALLLSAYLAASLSGIAFAYLIVLLAPIIGLVTGGEDASWFIFLPMIVSSNLLHMFGLEYGWRFFAIVLSPVLGVVPQAALWYLAQRPIFALQLPWQPSAERWILSHFLTAFACTLLLLWLDRLYRRRPRASETTS